MRLNKAIITVCLLLAFLYLLLANLNHKPKITTTTNPINTLPVSFSSDYTPAEELMVLDILKSSPISNWDIFGQIKYKKLTQFNYGALSNWGGETYINQKVFDSHDPIHIKQVIGHEVGHLLDFFTFSDQDRIAYAKLRGLKVENITQNWLQGYDEGSIQDLSIDQWENTPAEDMAQAFFQTYFNNDLPIDATASSELKQYFEAHIKEAVILLPKAKAEGLAPNALKMLNWIKSQKEQVIKLIKLPANYGPLVYLYPKKGNDQEYVFASFKLSDPKIQIQYNISLLGYDKYESYFQKNAKEIIYYGGINYYLLDAQGENKDFTLIADGEHVVMTNDQSLNKYDLMIMLKEGIVHTQ